MSILVHKDTCSHCPLFQIKDLKAKIQSEKGEKDYPVSGQKLIYAGKIMADEDELKEYNVDEKKFIVVMVAKVKAAAATSEGAKKEEGEKKEEKKEEKMEEEEKKEENEEKKEGEEKEKGEEKGETGAPTSDLVMGEDYNKMVENIIAMGYTREKVIKWKLWEGNNG